MPQCRVGPILNVGRWVVRVLVCGSRDWEDEDEIADVLADLIAGAPVTIVHGGARGADYIAGKIAEFYGYAVEVFPADWERYGKRAGFIRNVAMLDTRPDRVVAFQRNGSRGTQHTIDEARKRGIPVDVHSSAKTPEPQ